MATHYDPIALCSAATHKTKFIQSCECEMGVSLTFTELFHISPKDLFPIT